MSPTSYQLLYPASATRGYHRRAVCQGGPPAKVLGGLGASRSRGQRRSLKPARRDHRRPERWAAAARSRCHRALVVTGRVGGRRWGGRHGRAAATADGAEANHHGRPARRPAATPDGLRAAGRRTLGRRAAGRYTPRRNAQIATRSTCEARGCCILSQSGADSRTALRYLSSSRHAHAAAIRVGGTIAGGRTGGAATQTACGLSPHRAAGRRRRSSEPDRRSPRYRGRRRGPRCPRFRRDRRSRRSAPRRRRCPSAAGYRRCQRGRPRYACQ